MPYLGVPKGGRGVDDVWRHDKFDDLDDDDGVMMTRPTTRGDTCGLGMVTLGKR